MKMKTALTIAGSDSGGGAGIQADIKTMMANGVYAMSAITALTAQNTTKVADIMEVTPQFLAEQLDCIFTDIRPDAVKTGMVASAALIRTIAGKLTEYHRDVKRKAVPAGNGDHAEHSGGRSAGGYGDRDSAGYGKSSRSDRNTVWMLRSFKGRSSEKRCQRSALAEG